MIYMVLNAARLNFKADRLIDKLIQSNNIRRFLPIVTFFY